LFWDSPLTKAALFFPLGAFLRPEKPKPTPLSKPPRFTTLPGAFFVLSPPRLHFQFFWHYFIFQGLKVQPHLGTPSFFFFAITWFHFPSMFLRFLSLFFSLELPCPPTPNGPLFLSFLFPFSPLYLSFCGPHLCRRWANLSGFFLFAHFFLFSFEVRKKKKNQHNLFSRFDFGGLFFRVPLWPRVFQVAELPNSFRRNPFSPLLFFFFFFSERTFNLKILFPPPKKTQRCPRPWFFP